MTRLEAYSIGMFMARIVVTLRNADWSIGLHSILVYHDISNIKRQLQFEHSTGRVEVTHFEADPACFVTFGTLYAQKQTIPDLDPQLRIVSHGTELGVQLQDVHILDGEIEELSGKLDDYIKRMSVHFFESETSVLIKQTLILAAELSKITRVSPNTHVNSSADHYLVLCELSNRTDMRGLNANA